jgi:DNA modification methylase
MIDLYQGDCLEYMQTMQPGAVDAVITDPPYGIGKNNIVPFVRTKRNSNGRVTSDFSWDETKKTNEISEAISKSKVSIVFGGNYYADILPVSRCWLVWDKVNSGNFSDFEIAWTSMDKASKMFRYMWNGMIKEKPEERFHPTQKPLELMKWCIELATNPGDTVFDPFMGSGTTGVACVQTGRNFIGCEIDTEYFKIAERRIHQATLQPQLFQPDIIQAKQAVML